MATWVAADLGQSLLVILGDLMRQLQDWRSPFGGFSGANTSGLTRDMFLMSLLACRSRAEWISFFVCLFFFYLSFYLFICVCIWSVQTAMDNLVLVIKRMCWYLSQRKMFPANVETLRALLEEGNILHLSLVKTLHLQGMYDSLKKKKVFPCWFGAATHLLLLFLSLVAKWFLPVLVNLFFFGGGGGGRVPLFCLSVVI